MNRETFWHFIDQARAGVSSASDIEEVADRLVDLLAEQEPDLILAFESEMHRVMWRAYGHAIWGAAYVMNRGCGDDGFDYFLGWLIGQGRDRYERTIADPDSLAEIVSTTDRGTLFESEELMSAAWTAYGRATGDDLPEADYPPRPELGPGWDFDDDAEMARRYPRLTTLFR